MLSSSSQFLVSMKFIGIDQLSPTTKKMVDDLKSVKQAAQSTLGGMKSPKFIDDMSRGLQAVSKQFDELQKKAEHLRSSGFHDLLGGGAAVASVLGPVKKAGEIQMQSIQLGAVYNLEQTSEKLVEIKKQAKELSGLTLFSQKEEMGMALELAHAQVSKESIGSVLKQSSYLAEAEILSGKSSSPERSAYNFARMAEDARITTDAKKMSAFADSMYRVINVTHASSEGLGETFKYAMPVVKNLGWNENDLLNASALAAVNGMEGTMAGTHIKDFAERLNPYKFLGTRGGTKQLDAMNSAGLLNGVQYDKKGHVSGFIGAALLKDKDHIKSYSDMVGVLTEKHKDFIKAGKSELEWAATMNHIFGEQGQDFAIITAHKEAYDKLAKSVEGQKGLEEFVNTTREAFKGQAHILHSQVENLVTEIGNHLLPEVTALAKEMGPYVTNATQWVTTHKEEVVLAGKLVLAFGVFMTTLGIAKIAIGTVSSLLLGPAKSIAGAAASVLEALTMQKAADAVRKSASSVQSMQANVVNVYGKTVNGSGLGGTAVPPVGLPPRGSTSAKGGGLGPVMEWGKGVLKRGGIMLPIMLAMGAWDVLTAPEGKKVEASVKTSGSLIGGWAGAEAGVAMGAALGSVVPGIGTAIGGILGGIIGGIVGTSVANSMTDSILGLDKHKNWVKDKLLSDQSDQAQMTQAYRTSENQGAESDIKKSVFWNPKLDTSKYTSSGNPGSSKSFTDSSTNHFYIKAQDPGAVQDEISGNKANMARRHFIDSLAEGG